MAFPNFVTADTQAGTQTSNSSSWSGTYPTNLADGDLILLFVGADGGGTISSLPLGWVFATATNGSAVSGGWAKKKSDGTESGSFTIGLSAAEQGCWTTLRIAADDWEGTLGTTFDNTANSGAVCITAHQVGTSTSVDATVLNPNNWDVEDTFWIAVGAADHGNTTFTNFPALWAVDQVPAESGGSNGAALGYCSRFSATASQDPTAMTIDASEQWIAVTIGVRPAGAGTVTLTPSPVTLPLVVPAPSLQVGRNIAPAAVAIPLVVPAPTVGAGRILTPDPTAIPLVATTPTVSVGALVSPSPVTLPLVVPDPTLQIGRILTPDPVAIPLVVPAPSVAVGALVSPDPVAIVFAVPAPTVTAGSPGAGINITPDPVAVPLVVPAPTVAAGVLLSPSSVAIPLVVPDPSLQVGRILTPAPVAIIGSVPTPTVTAGVLLSPAPVAIPLVVPAPTVRAGVLVTPDPVSIALAVPSPSIVVSVLVSPSPVPVVFVLPAPAIDAGAPVPPGFLDELIELAVAGDIVTISAIDIQLAGLGVTSTLYALDVDPGDPIDLEVEG